MQQNTTWTTTFVFRIDLKPSKQNWLLIICWNKKFGTLKHQNNQTHSLMTANVKLI